MSVPPEAANLPSSCMGWACMRERQGAGAERVGRSRREAAVAAHWRMGPAAGGATNSFVARRENGIDSSPATRNGNSPSRRRTPSAIVSGGSETAGCPPGTRPVCVRLINARDNSGRGAFCVSGR